MGEMVERVMMALSNAGLVGVTEDDARAAIEAMREPSNAMIDRFVSRALCVSVHGEGGWSEYARGQWQTMIDAALAQPSAPLRAGKQEEE